MKGKSQYIEVFFFSATGSIGSETLKYKASRLFEGTEYFFRVAAENSVGIGEFATIEDGIVAKLPFGE